MWNERNEGIRFSWKKTLQHQIKELKSHKIERIIWHDWKGEDALGIKSILGVKSLKNLKTDFTTWDYFADGALKF